jgi:UDP-glucose:(heptosyl)LPS alpha-1,3-glucosyltransferase
LDHGYEDIVFGPPMKIAFLIERLDPSRGGMERSAVEFLTELAALGMEVHVVTQSAAVKIAGVQVHALGCEGWTDAAQYRRFVASAERFLAGQRWDVVHAIRPCRSCDVYQPRGGLVRTGQDRTIAARQTMLLKVLRRIGLLFDGKERLLDSLEQRLLTRKVPPLVLVPSHYVGRQVEAQYRLPDRSLRKVFNAVRISPPAGVDRATVRRRQRRDLGIVEDRPLAIFVGHNFRRKGLARVIDVLADPRCAGWHLLVVGRDVEHPYRRRAQRLAVADRVHFLGGRADVAELYWASDACVLPTYNDPCSRTVLEALSLGVPSITTAYDGSSECISNGEQGFVIPSPESRDQLALALRALENGATRRYMSQQAKDLAPVLSMRRHAAEVLQVYREIAARPSEPRILCPA